jgi:putative AlgH/UPF0301 family transcriptional regulator
MPGSSPPSGSSFSWRDFARRVFVGGLGWGALFTALALGLSPVSAMANVKQRGDWPFILAKGAMWDPMFRDSLVLIFDCGALSGAQGIVINKPAMGPLPTAAAAEAGEAAAAGGGESEAAAVSSAPSGPGSGPTLRGENLPTGQSWLVSQELARNPVFVGGPLALDAAEPLIVHGVPDVAGSHEALPGLFVGGDHRVLRRKVLAGACAPDEMLLVIGFSSWALGQLQSEFKRDSWAPGTLGMASRPETGGESAASTAASTSDGGERRADAKVRALLRAFNKKALGGDSWLTDQNRGDENAAIVTKFTSKDIDRGLAAMYAVEAPVSPLFGIEQVMGAVELPAKPHDGKPSDMGPSDGVVDAADVSAADAPEEWARIANAAAAMAVEHAKELAKRPPLFGDLQKRVAAETRQELEDRLAGRTTAADPESWTSNARPLTMADYLPSWDLAKFSRFLRRPKSGE